MFTVKNYKEKITDQDVEKLIEKVGDRETVEEGHQLFTELGMDEFYNDDDMEAVIKEEMDDHLKMVNKYLGSKSKRRKETIQTVIDNSPNFKKFVPDHQLKAVNSSELIDTVKLVEKELEAIPSIKSGSKIKAKDKIIYAHYFFGQTHIYVLEADDDTLFTYTILAGDLQNAELGYQSLEELTNSDKMELDFYWDIIKLKEVMQEEEEAESSDKSLPKFSEGAYVTTKLEKPDRSSGIRFYGVIKSVEMKSGKNVYSVKGFRVDKTSGKLDEVIEVNEDDLTSVNGAEFTREMNEVKSQIDAAEKAKKKSNKKAGSAKSSNKSTKQSTKPKANKQPTAKKKVNKAVNKTAINHYSESFKLLRRLKNFLKKDQVSFNQIRLLYSAYAKAAIEKKLDRDDPYYTLYKTANSAVTKMYQKADENKEKYEKVGFNVVDTQSDIFKKIEELVASKKIDIGVRLAKRFVSMQGRSPEKEKAKRLLKSIDKAIKDDNIKEGNRLFDEVKHAKKELEDYINDDDPIEPTEYELKKKSSQVTNDDSGASSDSKKQVKSTQSKTKDDKSTQNRTNANKKTSKPSKAKGTGNSFATKVADNKYHLNKIGITDSNLEKVVSVLNNRAMPYQLEKSVLPENATEEDIEKAFYELLRLNAYGDIKLDSNKIDISEIVNDNVITKSDIVFRKAPKSKKKGLESLKKIVSKDSVQGAITGVYAIKDYYVATDAHIFLKLRYDTNKEDQGKIINAFPKQSGVEGQYIDANYPKYEAIIPEMDNFSDSIDLKEFIDEIYSLMHFVKPVYNFKESFYTYFRYGSGKKDLIAFNTQLLYQLLNAMYVNDANSVKIAYTQHDKAMLIESDNGHLGLIMPLRVFDNNNDLLPDKMFYEIIIDAQNKGYNGSKGMAGELGNLAKLSQKKTNSFGMNGDISETLKNKAEKHNKEVNQESQKKTTASVLKAVYDRGMGAYKTNPGSVRNNVTSPHQWALGRVNSFLHALKKEEFKNGQHDTDLLPEKHAINATSGMNGAIDLSDEIKRYTEKAKNVADSVSISANEVEKIVDRGSKAVTKAKKPLKRNNKDNRIKKLSDKREQPSQFFNVAGQTGGFLQLVERKPKESVAITLDGPQGSGKTTLVWKMMNDFAAGGNELLFLSLEEHPDSFLVEDKKEDYIEDENLDSINMIGDIEDKKDFYNLVNKFDIIFIDSWQKLIEMVGKIGFDKDVRKKLDSKVFIIVFQQTSEGKTKGGSDIGFDGDIIIKLHKDEEGDFSKNYAYFNKHRYTKKPIDTLRFYVAEGVFEETSDDFQEQPEMMNGNNGITVNL